MHWDPRRRAWYPSQLTRRAMLLGLCLAAVSLAFINQFDLTTQVKGLLPIANGGTNTSSTLTGVVRGGSAYTAAELSGDATTSGSNAVTVVKVNGTTVATTTTLHQVLVTTASGVTTWKTVPDCPSGAIQYTQSSDTWSCGTVLTGTFADAEVPSGTIDGSNAVFTLAHTPSPAASLLCNKNGQIMYAGGTDYTLATATMTFVASAKPKTNDGLSCWYRY